MASAEPRPSAQGREAGATGARSLCRRTCGAAPRSPGTGMCRWVNVFGGKGGRAYQTHTDPQRQKIKITQTKQKPTQNKCRKGRWFQEFRGWLSVFPTLQSLGLAGRSRRPRRGSCICLDPKRLWHTLCLFPRRTSRQAQHACFVKDPLCRCQVPASNVTQTGCPHSHPPSHPPKVSQSSAFGGQAIVPVRDFGTVP